MQRWETDALGDANMRRLQKGEIVQLMRRGYFVVDLPFVRPGKPMVLLSIPDGKAKAAVKPEAAVKQAVAARDAAKAAAAAAAKNTASAAALKSKPKAGPGLAAAEANGAAGKNLGKKAEKKSQPRKQAVEAEPSPVSSKVCFSFSESSCPCKYALT